MVRLLLCSSSIECVFFVQKRAEKAAKSAQDTKQTSASGPVAIYEVQKDKV